MNRCASSCVLNGKYFHSFSIFVACSSGTNHCVSGFSSDYRMSEMFTNTFFFFFFPFTHTQHSGSVHQSLIAHFDTARLLLLKHIEQSFYTFTAGLWWPPSAEEFSRKWFRSSQCGHTHTDIHTHTCARAHTDTHTSLSSTNTHQKTASRSAQEKHSLEWEKKLKET